MTRRLFRTIYGAEVCQLPFNSSCTKEHISLVAVRVLSLDRLAKSPHYYRHYGNTSWASLLILRQGCRPFSEDVQPITVAPNLPCSHSHSSRWRKFMSLSSLPIRAHHRHLYIHQHTTHFSLHQIVNSWDFRHQCLQQQCRSYAKKGWDNQITLKPLRRNTLFPVTRQCPRRESQWVGWVHVYSIEKFSHTSN